MSYSVVGQSFPRIDALSQVTGKSIFGEDVKRPGMLFAKILRSKYAHARIKIGRASCRETV